MHDRRSAMLFLAVVLGFGTAFALNATAVRSLHPRRCHVDGVAVAAEAGHPQAPAPMTIGTLYRRHRFPREVIAHVVRLYGRFPLSPRMVEEMPLERGIEISYGTVRRWGMKFGPVLAHELRRRAPRPGDIWHLDEVRVVVRDRVHWLRRAVDQHGIVLDEVLRRRRDKRAARRLVVRLLKRQSWRPRQIVTDKMVSYGAAKREVILPWFGGRGYAALRSMAAGDLYPSAEWRRWVL